MQSSLKPKSTDDPHDFVVVPSDLVRVAPSDAEITDLLRAAARQSGAPAAAEQGVEPSMPAVDTTFRATAVDAGVASSRGRAFGRSVMRGLVALLLAVGIGAAALTWQAFGDAAKQAMANWLAQFALSSSLPLDKFGLGAGSTTPTSEPAAAEAEATPAPDAAAPPPAPAARETATADTPAPPTATPSADSAQLLLLQSTARDLANVSQEVETLKASIAELKANQQQMARDLAKAAEQNARAKLPPVHAPIAARRPPPVYSPTPTASVPAYRPTTSSSTTQAAAPPVAQPYVPRAVEPSPPPSDPGVTSVPRPPLPVAQ